MKAEPLYKRNGPSDDDGKAALFVGALFLLAAVLGVQLFILAISSEFTQVVVK